MTDDTNAILQNLTDAENGPHNVETEPSGTLATYGPLVLLLSAKHAIEVTQNQKSRRVQTNSPWPT